MQHDQNHRNGAWAAVASAVAALGLAGAIAGVYASSASTAAVQGERIDSAARAISQIEQRQVQTFELLQDIRERLVRVEAALGTAGKRR